MRTGFITLAGALGLPREPSLAYAQDAGWHERAALVFLAAACVALGTYPGGVVALIGVLDQPGGANSPVPLIAKAVTLAGSYVGSRAMFVAMNRFIEAAQLHPVIDKVFPFEKAQDAYAHQRSGSHLGKVVISLIE